jgi:peptidoglycan/LPS O-acetylase OafA/YrhL
VEEQFYLLLPVLLLVGLRRGWRFGRVLAFTAVASAVVGGMIAWNAGLIARAYWSPFPHLPVMLAGVALALAVRQKRAVVEQLGAWWAPVVGGGAIVAISVAVSHESPWLYYGGFAVIAGAAVLVIGHLIARPDGLVAASLDSRALVWLGERSYGFYLWHVPVVMALRRIHLPWPAELPIAFVGSLVLTVLSWTLVERPFLRLKRRFTVLNRPPVVQSEGPGHR